MGNNHANFVNLSIKTDSDTEVRNEKWERTKKTDNLNQFRIKIHECNISKGCLFCSDFVLDAILFWAKKVEVMFREFHEKSLLSKASGFNNNKINGTQHCSNILGKVFLFFKIY
jgi:hypothetical protein